MNKIYYIAIIVLLVLFAGCVEREDYGLSVGPSSDAVTVIGRITRFSDHDVTSRGAKNSDEGKITSMAIAIFPVKNDGTGLDGDCVFYQHADNQGELLFTIDRGNTFTKNGLYAMYVFANMPDMEDFGIDSSLDEMLNTAYEVNSINIPENGFPMIGSLGDTFSTTFERDGQPFVLSPTDANNQLTAPTVNGNPQTLITIPMKAMYAKINFSIEVRPDETVEGNYSPQFTFESYTVNNIPKYVDFDNSTNSDTEVVNTTITVEDIEGNQSASGANKITFSYYLPERKLDPYLKSHEGDKNNTEGYYGYPFTLVNGKFREEDLDHRQRFKSQLLVSKNQNDYEKKATNIVIAGKFRDHQNHYWDVNYTIYLGEDNYGDFNIKRNVEYNNYVTIRGIKNSNDMTDGSVAIDHRVNIERTQPAIISLRRETLLDSHFEVRPLRIKKTDVTDENINAVKIEVINPNTTNWMRLERSFGDGTKENSPTNSKGESIYIEEDENSPSYGKRKYFTYNLVYDTNIPPATDCSLINSTEVILPLGENDECCWIYVDECTEADDDVRTGKIRITYGKYEDGEFTDTKTNKSDYPDVDYVINQRKLFPVTYTDDTGTSYNYHIEYHEEYLYNYDAEDSFGQTDNEGMIWGLNNTQLSYEHQSISFNDGLQNWLTSGSRPYYDFYINKYDSEDANDSKGTLHSFQGYAFCNEIIATINNTERDTNTDNDINILTLSQKPKSAIEYCYNKNKRKTNGEVSEINWYLPAIDEMEDIIVSEYGNKEPKVKTYSRFIDFQNKFYWSCQPAFIRNFVYYKGLFTSNSWGPMYIDNINYARATKVNYINNEFKYAKSGLNLEKDSDGNDIYYNAFVYILGGILGTTKYTPDKYKDPINIDGNITISLKEPNTQEGYKSRNSMARIRCVRRL